MNVVHLEVTYPDGRRESVPVDAERVLVGSGAHCDLRLPAEVAANEHFTIELLGELLRFEVLAFEQPVKLDGQVVQRATLASGAVLCLGAVKICVTTSAVTGDVERVRARRGANGGRALRTVGLAAIALLGALAYFTNAAGRGQARTVAPPPLAVETAECPVSDRAQAGALALDKRIVADGKRERHPFYPAEGVEAVGLYAQSAACFRVTGQTALADELGAVARQLLSEVTNDARVRRLRLTRALAAGDTEISAHEVVALRALYLDKQGPYLDWLNGVALKLGVDKETR
jgi:hypothetical protein